MLKLKLPVNNKEGVMMTVERLNNDYTLQGSMGLTTKPSLNRSQQIILDTNSYINSHYNVFQRTNLSKHSDLGKQIYLLSLKETLNEDDIQTIVNGFKSSEFPKLKPYIAKILEKQSSSQLDTILKAIFKSHAFDDTQDLFKKLTGLLSLQKIESAVRSNFKHFEDSYKTALQISISAQRNLDTKQFNQDIKLKNTVRYYLSTTLDWFVESILFITQLVDVTDPDATMMEKQMVAQMRYQAFRDNLTIVSAGLLTLTLYTGSIAATIAVAVGLLIVSITSYVLYMNYLKGCPDQAHPGVNRTADASKGLISTVYGREESVKKLFDTLEGNTKTRARRYPMIRGGTGIGKSDLGNAMSLYLASPSCPKEWKGKKLFVISTADIVTGGAHGKMEHLHHIKDVLAGHEDEAILFFTEVHVGFEEKTSFLGQELKTLCDGPGGFPYMIFATTDQEYMGNIAKDSAFARRLEFFDIKPTTDQVTELIISDMVVREAADVYVSNQAIKEVSTIRSQKITVGDQEISVFENCPQPATSIAITSKVLANARHPWFKEKEQLLQELKNERCLLDHRLKLDREKDYLPYSEAGVIIQQELTVLEKRINNLEIELASVNTDLTNFRSLVKRTSDLQDEINKLSLKIKTSGEKKNLSEDDLSKFIILLNYLKPSMDQCLKEMSQSIEKASAIVDKKIMQEFITQEATAYLRKVQERDLAEKKAGEEMERKSKLFFKELQYAR